MGPECSCEVDARADQATLKVALYLNIAMCVVGVLALRYERFEGKGVPTPGR